MQSHCMTVSDMVHHVQLRYPGISNEIIISTINMMIDENLIFESITVNWIRLYCNFKNPHLIQKIWIYLIQMNYSASYDDILDAFSMTLQDDIANAIGIMVAKNIITKNKTIIRISKVERQNILYNYSK